MVYSMPPDTNEKEKIIGGIFTLGQAMWIGIGAIGFALTVILFFKAIGFASVFFGLPFLVFGFVFALKKVNDLPLPTYIKFKRRYKNKIKYYINSGKHSVLSFSDEKKGA